MKLTKKTTFLAIGIFTLLVASISSVFAFGGHHHDPEEKVNYIVNKITKKLSLNSEQQDKLAIAKSAALQLHQAMHQDKQALQQDMLALVNSDTLDQTLILNHIKAKTEAVDAYAPEVVAAVAEFYNSLDSQQQAKVRSKVQKAVEHMQHHHDD